MLAVLGASRSRVQISKVAPLVSLDVPTAMGPRTSEETSEAVSAREVLVSEATELSRYRLQVVATGVAAGCALEFLARGDIAAARSALLAILCR